VSPSGEAGAIRRHIVGMCKLWMGPLWFNVDFVTVFHIPYCRLIFIPARGFRGCKGHAKGESVAVYVVASEAMRFNQGCHCGFVGTGRCRTTE